MKHLITLFTLVFVTCFASAQPSQPNIVFILVDDMGWGDLGINFQNEKTGKKHFTPELDALSQEGVRMLSHYCPAPICAPSRASLFLGQHQGHADIRDKQFDKALPNQLTIGSAMHISRLSLQATLSLSTRTSRSLICRRSCLKCTVIPLAPANSQSAAAQTGSGSSVRRA